MNKINATNLVVHSRKKGMMQHKTSDSTESLPVIATMSPNTGSKSHNIPLPLKYADVQWMNECDKVKAYVAKHGKIPISKKGNWCSIQRKMYRNGNLPPWKIKALESIQDWDWDYDDYIWNRIYNKVKIIIESGKPIRKSDHYGWCVKQKKIYNEGGMTPGRIAALEKIKGWKWESCNARWNKSYDEVLQYVIENGYFPPYSRNDWVSKQMMYYKQNMIKQRAEKLEKIPGWEKLIKFGRKAVTK